MQWLYLLTRLRLGACLADDMGLGKTIQVLSLMLVLKEESGHTGKPSLVVAPASLLANWAAEMAQFAPNLKAVVAHPSAMPTAQLKSAPAETLAYADLVITRTRRRFLGPSFIAQSVGMRCREGLLAFADTAQKIIPWACAGPKPKVGDLRAGGIIFAASRWPGSRTRSVGICSRICSKPPGGSPIG